MQYEVDDIISHELLPDGKYQYFVHWKDYPDTDNSWVHADDMDCDWLISKYHETKNSEESDEEDASSGDELSEEPKPTERKVKEVNNASDMPKGTQIKEKQVDIRERYNPAMEMRKRLGLDCSVEVRPDDHLRTRYYQEDDPYSPLYDPEANERRWQEEELERRGLLKKFERSRTPEPEDIKTDLPLPSAESLKRAHADIPSTSFEQKRLKTEATNEDNGFVLGLKVDKLVDFIQKDGKTFALVKFHNSSKIETLDIEVVNTFAPALLAQAMVKGE